jgi:hypothetical protein
MPVVRCASRYEVQIMDDTDSSTGRGDLFSRSVIRHFKKRRRMEDNDRHASGNRNLWISMVNASLASTPKARRTANASGSNQNEPKRPESGHIARRITIRATPSGLKRSARHCRLQPAGDSTLPVELFGGCPRLPERI